MLLSKTVFLISQEIMVDSIMFHMLHFNIILGMDFLSHYRVEINYKKKKVQFWLENGEEFSFGEGRVLNTMISSLKVRKMLMKRCTWFFAHVISKPKEITQSL